MTTGTIARQLRPPAPVRALNALGRAAERRGWRPVDLSERSLRAAARRRMRLDDFGDDSHRANLDALVRAYDAADDLGTLGRLGARQELVRGLCNRLEVEAAFARRPAIADESVSRPIFVTGLPRTGTTLLHNLLALDASTRAPLLWELMYPGAPHDPRERRRRVRWTARQMALAAWIQPHWRTIHPMGPTEPEECLFLLQNCFASLDASFRASVPGYVAHLFARDMTPDYHYHRRQLQAMQWREPPRRWVLKSPGHLLALDAIAAVYPDAAIVHLHRDPREVVGSLCSMFAAVRSLMCDRVDLERIGAQALDWWGELADRAIASRTASDASRVLSVAYEDLLADPIAVLRRVYAHFDYAWPADLAERAHGWLADHPQHSHGVHRYDLGDFGLTPADVAARFAGYVARWRPAA